MHFAMSINLNLIYVQSYVQYNLNEIQFKKVQRRCLKSKCLCFSNKDAALSCVTSHYINQSVISQFKLRAKFSQGKTA